jgi:hypothetical protein
VTIRHMADPAGFRDALTRMLGSLPDGAAM